MHPCEKILKKSKKKKEANEWSHSSLCTPLMWPGSVFTNLDFVSLRFLLSAKKNEEFGPFCSPILTWLCSPINFLYMLFLTFDNLVPLPPLRRVFRMTVSVCVCVCVCGSERDRLIEWMSWENEWMNDFEMAICLHDSKYECVHAGVSVLHLKSRIIVWRYFNRQSAWLHTSIFLNAATSLPLYRRNDPLY